MFGEICFKAFGELTAGQQDPSPTAFTFQANVRAETDHDPLIRTAGVLLSQAQMIVQL